ncbi:LysR family transcriptional regulator [Gymnodinialimonas ceratoperidinii]|uniref:LysR family transcriptional regulator n=1 Tax=Gymnodinialimonas ceratoperidinii TaxID=2856823 RepID=A0A8F6TW16_9RHOB|nr:LysR family transcriptional regulator [Gymnodinialimonas ceratoperidinii]QXT39508.1 LysR family transcriptional regulator [Gymnodinialimonas ceratoperidinii]
MLYLTLRQYEYIVGVADAGSLTHAAAVLNVSQPSLSTALTRVEARLGAAIFQRGKGAALAVTPFGHRIIDEARSLLAHAARIENHRTEAQATFTLGCFEDLAAWYLAPSLASLAERFPETRFQSREGRFASISADLSEGRMDAAICYDVGFGEGFLRRRIREVSPVAFLAPDHPLATRSALSLHDVAAHPVILFSEEVSDGFMRDLFARTQLAPEVRQRVASVETMRSLAAHGAGIGISYAQPPTQLSYDGKPLVTVPITDPEARAAIVLVWSSLRERDPRFDAILDALA